jgi:hypothetical protein
MIRQWARLEGSDTLKSGLITIWLLQRTITSVIIAISQSRLVTSTSDGNGRLEALFDHMNIIDKIQSR